MRRVSFDDDWATCGERCSRIAACHRKGQREIARAEYHDRPERHLALSQIGTRGGRAFGQCRIHANAEPAALA
jgi:hypothetical protein